MGKMKSGCLNEQLYAFARTRSIVCFPCDSTVKSEMPFFRERAGLQVLRGRCGLALNTAFF